MEYTLRQFPSAPGIDVWVNAETKTVDRGESGEILLGSFFMGLANDLQFHQPENYQFDLEDMRLLVMVAEQIEVEGFNKIYEESKL